MVPPLDLKKYFFSYRVKSFFYQSHCIALGLTIPKWYNTWVLKIFFVNIFSKIFFRNIFSNFWKKYLQKIFPIPKCYTILESWDQMQKTGFDWKMILGDLKKKYILKRNTNTHNTATAIVLWLRTVQFYTYQYWICTNKLPPSTYFPSPNLCSSPWPRVWTTFWLGKSPSCSLKVSPIHRENFVLRVNFNPRSFTTKQFLWY